MTTEAGEVVFVTQSGTPLYNATLKIGPLILPRDVLAKVQPGAPVRVVRHSRTLIY